MYYPTKVLFELVDRSTWSEYKIDINGASLDGFFKIDQDTHELEIQLETDELEELKTLIDKISKRGVKKLQKFVNSLEEHCNE